MRALVLAVLLTSGIAHADTETLEWSPSVLDRGEVRVGPGTVGVGLWDRLELDTHPIVYSAYAAGASAYDVSGKLEVLRTKLFAASLGVGVTNVALGDGSTTDPNADTLVLRVVPVSAWAAVKPIDRLRLTAGVVYADVAARGHTTMDIGSVTGAGGTFAGSNAEVYASAQVGMGRGWSAFVGFRGLAWADSDIDVTAMTDAGEKSGHPTGQTAASGAWAASAAVHLTQGSFNLRLGVEYGNYHVPIVDLVAAQRGWLPVVDVYWRL